MLKAEIKSYLQEYSLKKILALNAFQYIEDHSAIKQTVITRGEQSIKNIISLIVLNLLPVVTQITFSICAIFLISPILSIMTLVVLVIATIWSSLFSSYHRPFIRKDMNNWDNFGRFRSETFQHLTLIKNSGAEKSYLKDYNTNRSKNTEYFLFTYYKSLVNTNLRFVYFNFSKSLITLIIVYQAALGKLVVGNIYAIWSWMNDAFNNIGNITQMTREIPLNLVEIDKYIDIIDKKPEFDESGVKKFSIGDIEFHDVSFKYPKGENYLLEDLNLKLPKGKKIAFVGFSGSGKSTITKLLLRMYDWNSGDIEIDGKSLRDLDSQVLRQKIGYVEQHVDLFDTTIRENILFGLNNKNKNISEDFLNKIIHKARIDQFFHRLGTTGLDTIIGERGVKLSGGERQRIGIARALVKNPELLIFDEATASLDTENEKYIQEAIDESSKGRTTIIIAHRLSTIQNSDIIFVMDKGKIVGQGTHEELKDNNPEYQRLIHAQSH
jgi:ABC-type multidrug transport system fused ATPase/permease subunit